MTGFEFIMNEILERLRADPPLLVNVNSSIRRAHLTDIPRDRVPAIYIYDQLDGIREVSGQCPGRTCNTLISVFGRTDAGVGPLDLFKIEITRRLKDGWPNGIAVRPGMIDHDSKSADLDAQRVNMEFKFNYDTPDIWSLELTED